MTEPLAEFLADFYGVVSAAPIDELQAWCASSDGQAHAAPHLTIDAITGVTFASDADRVRFAAMQDAMSAWIIGTLQRPPGWAPRPGSEFTTSTPPVNADAWLLNQWRPGLQPDSPNWTVADGRYRFSNELRDWARAWTAAHP